MGYIYNIYTSNNYGAYKPKTWGLFQQEVGNYLTPQNGINGSTPKIGFLFRLKPVEYSHATCFVFGDVNEREQCCQRPVRTKPIHTHSQNVHHTSGHSPILIHKPELTQCSFKNMLFHGKTWFMLEFHEWIVVPNIGEYMLV